MRRFGTREQNFAALASRFRSGDEAAWADFLRQNAHRIAACAMEWSVAICRETPCCAKGAFRRTLNRFLASECDLVSEAFLYLCEQIRRLLRTFEGRCSPEAWLAGLLTHRSESRFGYEQLRAGFLRDRLGGRVRPPACLQDLPAEAVPVLRGLLHGQDKQTIAARTGLAEPDVEAVVQTIEDRLRAQGPQVYWYWLGHLRALRGGVQSLSAPAEDEEAPDPPSPSADVSAQVDLRAIRRALAAALVGLDELERLILALRFEDGRSARSIAQAFALAGRPEIRDQREVYTVQNRALRRLAAALRTALAGWGELEAEPERLGDLLETFGVRSWLAASVGNPVGPARPDKNTGHTLRSQEDTMAP